MNILAIETATEACSVALLTAQDGLFAEFEITPRKHTEYLPRMLESVFSRSGLSRAQTDCLAVTNGPGAFTGVRIGAAMAQGMALGLQIPMVTVSTLAVMAQQACDEFDLNDVLATLDARMGEVYCGLYRRNPDSGLVQAVADEALLKLDQLEVPDAVTGVGSGYRALREAGLDLPPENAVLEQVHPSAAALAKLAVERLRLKQTCRPDSIEINYIRDQVAWKK